MTNRNFFCFILLLVYSVSSFAQSEEKKYIDSLVRILPDIKDEKSKVRTLIDLCNHNYSINPDVAIPYGVEAIELSEKINWINGIAFSNNSLGVCYALKSDYPKSLEYFLKALKLFESNANKNGLANVQGKIGTLYSHLEKYDESLDYSLRALKIYEELKDSVGIGSNLGNIGIIYHQKKENATALDYYTKALNLFKALNNKSSMGINLENIANLFVEQKRYKDALDAHLQALVLKKTGEDNRIIAHSYSDIGKLYLSIAQDSLYLISQEGKKESKFWYASQAKLYTDSSISFSKACANLELLYINYNRMSTLHNLLGEDSKALYYYKQYSLIKDSVFNIEKDKKTTQTLMQYEFDKKEAATKAEQEKKELAMQKELELKALNYEYERKQIAAKTEKERQKLKFEQLLKQQQIEANYAQKSAEAEAEHLKNEAAIKAQQAKKDALVEQEKQKQKLITNAITAGLVLVLLFALFIFRSYRQKQKANKIITLQKEEVEEKNRQITDSITYALRIQTAILPPSKLVKQYLDNSFILYKPKDIVAGDFYWMENIGSANSRSADEPSKPESILFAACDCTGHGVSGAMVSVICYNALNRAVKEFGLLQPAAILDKVNELVIENFSKGEDEVKDGMDISLCALHFQESSNNQPNYSVKVEWAGANSPLWILSRNKNHENEMQVEVNETKADKQPIGKFDKMHAFTNHSFELNKGDSIYIFSDGYADQFGGESGKKKLTRKRFRDLILSLQHIPFAEQGKELDKFITNYLGNNEQIDDILVMGVQV